VGAVLLPRLEALERRLPPPVEEAEAKVQERRLPPPVEEAEEKLCPDPAAITAALVEALVPRLVSELREAAAVAAAAAAASAASSLATVAACNLAVVPPSATARAAAAMAAAEVAKLGSWTGAKERLGPSAVEAAAQDAPMIEIETATEWPVLLARGRTAGSLAGEWPEPSLATERKAPTLSDASVLKRVRRLRGSTLESALRKAFVVNFRRLMKFQKVLAVIHDLIKSTAIAALTLVLAGDSWQLGYSVMFVAIVLMFYVFHAAHYDTMDIGDYKHLADLLEDDDGDQRGGTVENPNRLLKAMKLCRRGRRRRALIIMSGFALLCLVLWTLVVMQWLGCIEWKSEFLRGEFYPTLLLVGTLMLLFHTFFEWLYWRETQCVMPLRDPKSGASWDPRQHGVPPGYRWFGLPSMWFSSAEAYKDLRLWITHARDCDNRKRSVVEKVFPEEMAIFALDVGGGCLLRSALLHAKLYHAKSGQFLTRGGGLGSNQGKLAALLVDPTPPRVGLEELGIDLAFYDSQSKEYLQPEEDYRRGQVHLLRRESSCSVGGSARV